MTLLFEQDETTKHRYGGYRELAIERVVHRDGVSQYRLNGKTCRRRDIHELFQGTGLGSHHYAVIEQGMIGRMIEAKPHELRAYIEEAAGVSLYKERHQAAEQEMQQTMQNLTRISDLRQDLGAQAQALQTQAQQAEQYRALQTAQATTEQTLAFAELVEQERLLAVAKAEQAKVTQALQAQTQQWQALNQDTDALKQQIQTDSQAEQDCVDALLKQHQSWLQCEKEREQARHQQQMQQQTLRSETSKCEQLQQSIQAAEAKASQLQAKRDQVDQQLAQQSQHKRSQQDELEALDAQLQGIQRQWQQQTQTHEGLQQDLLKHQQQASKVAAQIQFCDQQSQALEQQARQRQAQAPQCVESLVFKLESSLQQQQLRHQNLQAQRQAYDQLESQRSALSTQILQSQVQQAENEGLLQASKLWLAQNLPQDQDTVAQAICCDEGWHLAVQRLLGAYLVQPLGTPGFARLSQAIDWGVLRAEVNLAPWLQQVSFVTEFSESVANDRFEIKPDGSMQGLHWQLPALESAQGVLFHQQQVQALTQQCQELNRKIQQDQLQEAELHTQQQQIKQAIQAEQQAVVEGERATAALQSQIEQAQLAQKQQQMAEQQWQQEVAQNEAAWQDQQHKAQIAQEKIAQVQQEQQKQQAFLAELKQRSASVKAQHQAVSEQLTQVTQAYQDVQKQSLTLELEAKYQTQALNKLHNRLAYHQARLAEAKLSKVSYDLTAIEPRLQQLAQEKQAATEVRARLKQQLQTAQQNLQVLLSQQKNCDAERQQLQQQNQKIAVTATKHQGLLEQLAEQLPSGYDKAFYTNLLAESSSAQLQQKLQAQQQEIDALGAVNLTALSQFEALSERQSALEQEWQDVTQGLQDLKQAIEVMDAATKKQFKQTFKQVQANFKRLFVQVFEGGKPR